MKARGIVVAVAVGLACVGGLALAKDKEPDGRTLYREYCKPCHRADSPNGEYTPMTLIQEQWQRFFKEKYVPAHEKLTDPNHGNKAVKQLITPDRLKKIEKFAVDHAADSEHPMTCG
jgi:hypothetical protein